MNEYLNYLRLCIVDRYQSAIEGIKIENAYPVISLGSLKGNEISSKIKNAMQAKPFTGRSHVNIVFVCKDSDNNDAENQAPLLYIPAVYLVDENKFVCDYKAEINPKAQLPFLAGKHRYDADFTDYCFSRKKAIANLTWEEYIDYSLDMLSAVLNIKDEKSEYKSRNLAVNICDSSFTEKAIYEFYREVAAKDNVDNFPLLNNMISPQFEKNLCKINLDKDLNAKLNLNHLGQMSKEYSLSALERELVCAAAQIADYEILSIDNSPIKDNDSQSLADANVIRSIVADAIVSHALAHKDAPIILITSSASDSLENLIDLFSCTKSAGKVKLARRWVNDVQNFATYFPSNDRKDNAVNDHIQWAGVKKQFNKNTVMYGFLENAISTDGRDEQKATFLKNYNTFLKCNEELVSKNCSEMIYNLLHQLNILLVNILDMSTAAFKTSYDKLDESVLTSEQEIIDNNVFIENVKKKIDKATSKLEDWSKFKGHNLWLNILNLFGICREKTRNLIIELTKDERDCKIELPSGKFNIAAQIKTRIEYWSHEKSRLIELKRQYDDNNSLLTASIDKANRELQMPTAAADRLKNNELNQKLLNNYSELRNLINSVAEKTSERKCISEDEYDAINLQLDKTVRNDMFWFAVHYYESQWLSTACWNIEVEHNINAYKYMSNLSPCFLGELSTIPKVFRQNPNFADLLIVDRADEIPLAEGIASFGFAKKAIVIGKAAHDAIGNTSQINADIKFAMKAEIISDDISSTEEYDIIKAANMTNASSSIVDLAVRKSKFQQ